MRTRPIPFVALAVLLGSVVRPAIAADPPVSAPVPTTPAPGKSLVVAVLDFTAAKDEMKELAGTLPDLVEAAFGESASLRLVTRRELKQIQEEQKLDLAGLVAQGKGAQVGKLLGAQVLVVGRVSLVDDEVVLTAKAIGTETGAFLPVVVRAPAAHARAKLGEDLAKRLRKTLEERSADLLPPPSTAEGDVNGVREKIAALGGPLPRVAVEIDEKHLRIERMPDPAAESAFLTVLPALGYPLAAVGGSVEAEWLRKAAAGHPTFPAPTTLAADVVIAGEGFSEYGGRVGELVSCRARLEVRAYDARTGAILGTYAGGGSAADVSEAFAGKKALDELGRRAALELGLAIAKARKDAPK